MIKNLHAEFLAAKEAQQNFAEERIVRIEDKGTHVASESGKGAPKRPGASMSLHAKSASVAWRPREAPDTQLPESDKGP
jgi:hypothetical protein